MRLLTQDQAERKRAYLSAYRETHRETARATSVRWRKENPERKREQSREHYAANVDTYRHNSRAWNEANAERKRQMDAAHYEANAEKRRAMAREWRRANPESVAEYALRRRARKMASPVIERVVRSEIIARDKSVCHLCGLLVPADDIHLDHIIPLVRGGFHTASNVAVSHSACNLRKGDR